MGLNLSHEVHDNYHDNQQRGATEVELYVPGSHQELGYQTDKGNIERTCQCQASHNLIDVTCCLLARADPRDKGSTLLQVICCLAGLNTNAV